MNKEFIPYEQSLSLEELGFDEPCFGAFNKSGVFQRATSDWWDKDTLIRINSATYADLETLAPLYQQAFKFFREKYKLCNNLGYTKPWKYSYHITSLEISKTFEVIDGFNTYEEAELECLKKLIEIVKGK